MISPAKGSENTEGGGCACCYCWFYISAVKARVMTFYKRFLLSVGKLLWQVSWASCRSRRRWSAKERSAEETVCEGTIGTSVVTRDDGFPRRSEHIAEIGNVLWGVRDHRQINSTLFRSFQFSTLCSKGSQREVVSDWKSCRTAGFVINCTECRGCRYLTAWQLIFDKFLLGRHISFWQTRTWEQPQRPTGVDCKTLCKSLIECPWTAKDNQGARIHDSWSLINQLTALQTWWCGLNWGYDVDKKKLGEGSYGTVSICTNKAWGNNMTKVGTMVA